MGWLSDWWRRRSEEQAKRHQEMLDRGLEIFEAKHATLMEELRAAGHDPHVIPKWIDNPNAAGSWQFSLACRKCLRRHRGMAPKRLRLFPEFPCEGDGPSMKEWIAEGFAGMEIPEGKEITVVEVRARTVAHAVASAATQLGLPEAAIDVHVVDEGGMGRQAVIWARPAHRT